MHFLDFFLHIDKHLDAFFHAYGMGIYALLFLIIFAETGLVVTPFLPGDSLLFAMGALTAATTGLNIWVLAALLVFAAIFGNVVNYSIGRWIGPKVFHEGNRWFKREYLLRAHGFYEKYGGKAIVLTRFVPIIRTFVPFVAGVGTMDYGKFMLFNVVGGVAWVGFFLLGGFYLGNLPGVKNNMHIIVLLIIFVSLLPVAFEIAKGFLSRPKSH